MQLIGGPDNTLNCIQKKKKNISRNVAERTTQHEIPYMNFESVVPEIIAQHVFLIYNVIQIKGEYCSD